MGGRRADRDGFGMRAGGRRRLTPLLVLVVLALLVPLAPAAVAAPRGTPTTAPHPGQPSVSTSATVSNVEIGSSLAQAAVNSTCGGPGQPACQTVSSGSGGFIPLAAQRVLDTREGTGGPLGSGKTRVFAVGGVGSVPADGVKAVVLSVTALDSTGWSAVTVWPAGSTRPAVANLSTQPGRAQQVVAVVPLGANGQLAVANDRGSVHVAIDVVGWFAGAAEYVAVSPYRLFDSGPFAKQKPAPIGPDKTTEVAVAGKGGVPATGVAAVVLSVSDRSATAVSAVTVWPTGAARPAAASLVVQPDDRRDNLAVVALGTGGSVSVHNAAGWASLAIDVVGYLPVDSSYRPVAAANIFATPAGAPLAAGATAVVQVTGLGGVPAIDDDAQTEDAHTVVLDISATPTTARASTLTAWRTGDQEPATTSVATTATMNPTETLAVVPLSPDGRVSITNHGAAAVRLSVAVAGWFATPKLAMALEVPPTTKAPAEEDVASIQVTTDPQDPGTITGATVALDPSAPDMAAGDHLVLGVTPETPLGLLGTVTSVSPSPDGGQVVTTTPATLEDVFAAADIAVDLAAAQPTVQAAGSGGFRLAAAIPEPDPDKGIPVDDPFAEDDETSPCSAEGLTVDYGPYFNMEFRIRWQTLAAPKVTALATLGAQALIELKNLAIKCSWEKVIWEPAQHTYSFMVGTFPVVLAVKISAELDVAAGLADLDLLASAKAWVTIGVKDNRPYTDAGYEFKSSTFDDLKLQARLLRAYAQVDTWLDFGVLLYGVVGPRIGVGPFAEAAISATVHDPPTPWWTLDIGLAGRVSIDLDLWFAEWNYEVWNGEIPLADFLNLVGVLDDCTGESKAFATAGPCRSPVPAMRADGSTRDHLDARIRLASAKTGFEPLRIVPPDTTTLAKGRPLTLVFGKTGDWSSDALIRVVSGGIPGMSFADADADGWSASGIMTGAPTTVEVYPLTLEIRYKLEADPPDLTLRRQTTISFTVLDAFTYVQGWGSNSSGQYTVPDGLYGATAVSAGDQFSLALTGGRPIALNLYGFPTVPTAAKPAMTVAAGYGYALALKTNRTVVAWGQNDAGQTDVPAAASTPSTDPAQQITAIAAGQRHALAAKGDGSVLAWGSNNSGQTTVPTSVSAPHPDNPVIAVAAGGAFSLALRANGTVVGWGSLSGGSVPSSVSSPNATNPVVAIAAGGGHGLALRKNGVVVAWGLNLDGQATVPASVGTVHADNPVVAIAAGYLFSLALRSDGSIVAWGDNEYGQTTIPAIRGKVLAISAGLHHAIALVAGIQEVKFDLARPAAVGVPASVHASATSDLPVAYSSVTPDTCSVDALSGEVTPLATGTCTIAGDQAGNLYWGPAPQATINMPVQPAHASVVGWGRNTDGQASAPEGIDSPVQIAVGWDHALALQADGTLAAWGDNTYGEATIPAGLGNVVAIDAGQDCNLALRSDGTVAQWGWATCGTVPADLKGVVAIAVGDAHNLALRSDGTVRAWGTNGRGQSNVPTTLTDAIAVAAGGHHSLALKATGEVVGWGSNSYGQITIPTAAKSGVVAIAAGEDFSVALKADGTVVAWGANTVGQGKAPDGLSGVTAITAGYVHAAALKSDTTVVAWGDNTAGQKDVPEGLSRVIAIDTRYYTNLALVASQPQAIDLSAPPTAAVGGSAMVHGTATSGLMVTFTSLTPDVCTVRNEWGVGILTLLSPGTCTMAGDQAGNDDWSPAAQATRDIQVVLADARIRVWGETFSADQADVPGAVNATQVSAGDFHTLALLADGTVVAWGANFVGQTDVPAGLTDVRAVAAGSWVSLALKTDGTIVGWGNNEFGQLDIPAGLNDAKAIAVGGTHVIALRADGTVVGWGDNGLEQITIPSGLDHVVAIAAGNSFSLALRDDGTIVAWGDNQFGQCTIPLEIGHVVAIAAGSSHVLALRDDGTVVAWGTNDSGESAVPAGLTGVASIAAGSSHSIAVTESGTVVSWGAGSFNPAYDVNTVPPEVTEVVSVALGVNHAVALSVRRPQSIAFDLARPAVVGGDATARAVASSAMAVSYASDTPEVCSVYRDSGVLTLLAAGTCTITADQPGSLRWQPAAQVAQSLSVLPAGAHVVAWGSDASGQTTLPPLTQPVAVAAGGVFSLALRSDGTVAAWGDNTFGETDVPLNLKNVVAVAAGDFHALALRADGTVVAWGNSQFGQADVPAGLSGVVAIAAGADFSLALRADGSVVAWGHDDLGQATVPAGLGNVTAISAGRAFALALQADGTVAAWGANDLGQTGVPLGLSNVVAIAAGGAHALALLADGSVVAWGDNATGQATVPAGLAQVTAIGAGMAFSLALRSDGSVAAWGDNTSGQTGIPAGLPSTLAVSAGGSHVLALVAPD